MKVDVTHLSPIKKALAVEVPSTDVQTVYGDLLRSYAKQVRVPGFRPGKAPLEMVRARIGKDLGSEAAERLVERFSAEAIRREGLRPVAGGVSLKLPDGEEAPQPVREGEAYSFAIDVEVLPELELQPYTGLKVARPSVEVETEDVQREMEAIRQSFGKLVDVTDRASQAGDYLSATLTGVELGGSIKLESQRHTVHLGGQGTLPEFDRAMTGKRAGDDVGFEVTYPQDFPNEEVRGKTLTFSGSVEEIKTPDVPELTDELVKTFGVESVAELREKVRERLLLRKNQEADRTAKTRLVERLLDAHPFDAPDSMIDYELRQRLEDIGRNLASQGVDPDKVDIDWKQVLEKEREGAVRRVKEEILIDAVVRKEGMTLSREEFELAMQMLARDAGMKLDEVRSRMKQRGVGEELAAQVLRGKCLDWLLSQADIV